MTDSSTFLRLGESLLTQSRWEEAADAFRKSISLDAQNAWPHHHLGDTLCRLGLFPEAITAYERALALAPESPWTLHNLGDALSNIGRWEQAEAAFGSAVRLDSSQPLSYFHLGEVLAHQNRWEEAAEAFRSSIALDAEDARPHQYLGHALSKCGHFAEAVDAYLQAQILSPESPGLLQNLGNALLKLERWEAAADAYQQSLSTEGNDAETSINLGSALSKLERWKEAESAYLRARSVGEEDPRVTEALGGVWLKLECWQKAASAYETCLALSPDNMELQRNLGIAVFKLEAQKAYRKIHPGTPMVTPFRGDDNLPLPELQWTEAHLGARVFEIEHWIESLIPKGKNASIASLDGGERSSQNPRLLFILDNDFGELTTVMYLLLGQEWVDRAVVLMPERLYSTNGQAIPGRSMCYTSVEDVERIVDSFRPDIVFLCSGYLYPMHDLFSHQQLESFVDVLDERDCKVVTADPFLGMLSRQPVSSLISVDVPDESDLALPAHVFQHLQSVKVEQDEWIVEKLSGAERILRERLHLYPAHAIPAVEDASATDAREIAFSNPNLIYKGELEPDAGTKPHWIFILSTTDLDTQLMFEAVRGFTEIVASLLQQTIKLGRRPIFVGPEKFIRDLIREMRGHEGAELLSFCSFTRLASLLLTAEHAFYWNSVSHSILLRSFNGLPVVLFDRGHLVRNVEAIYERVVQWYYQGMQPSYMDHSQPLTLESIEAAIVNFKRAAGQMSRGFQRAPDPESLIQGILGATRPVTC